jgi:hypothetical protein
MSRAFLPSCPGCNSNCSATSCDNRIQKNNNCQVTCPKTCDVPSLEWCTKLVDFQVTIVASSSNGRDWTDDGEVICAKGSYGSSPSCYEESYCTNHQSIRQECVFEYPGMVCVDE